MVKVLVTGANGMLAQDLIPTLEDENYEVIEANKKILDITNLFQVKSVIEKENPDIVIHCAAYTNVEKAQDELQIARNVNVDGTENLAKICAQKDIELVYISTDYVFDGNKKTPYEVDDEPNPINNYGLTKLEGERIVQKYCEKYYIIRTSWLYGHYGKNFVETMLSLSDKEELKVVDDQIGCPTWTMDLSNAIVKILDEEYGIYHACGSGETSWYGFAKEIFKLADKKVNLIPCNSDEFKTKAKRPKYSVMNNNKICRNWELALKDYMLLRLDDEDIENE